MSENLGISYWIETCQGPTYDIKEKLKSPLFMTKRGYIREFIARDGIVYPWLKSRVVGKSQNEPLLMFSIGSTSYIRVFV